MGKIHQQEEEDKCTAVRKGSYEYELLPSARRIHKPLLLLYPSSVAPHTPADKISTQCRSVAVFKCHGRVHIYTEAWNAHLSNAPDLHLKSAATAED